MITCQENPVELLIVEDDPISRDVLRDAADQIACISRVHCAPCLATGQQRLNAATPPGLLLCDLGLPDGDGLKLCAIARERQVPTIVVSVLGDEQTVIRAIELGVCGYLHKGLEKDEVSDAIRQVFAGGSPLSPSIASHLLRRLKNRASGRRSAVSRLFRRTKSARQLTRREKEILQLIARGYLLDEVATELGISSHTVSNHNRNIYRKLRAHSRSEAVFKALSSGMLASD